MSDEGVETPAAATDEKEMGEENAISDSGNGDSTKEPKKFSVHKVKFGPELNDPLADTATDDANEPSSPSIEDGQPKSPMTPEHFTFGYATNEAIPMTIFYRSQHSHGHSGKQRPTLQELRKGLENDKAEFVEQPAPPDDKKMEEGSDPLEVRNRSVLNAPKFGWIKGVLFGCLLNIWGVMLYLRLSWVVGHAGIGLATVIVLLSAVVTTLTTLSMSAVCTNGEVKGGE